MKIDSALYSTQSVAELLDILISEASELCNFSDCVYRCYSTENDWKGTDHTQFSARLRSGEGGTGEINFASGDSIVVSPGNEASQVLTLVSLELNIKDIDKAKELVKTLSIKLEAAYAFVDQFGRSPVLSWELDSRKSYPSPYWCLRDLYWYNYFGKGLVSILCELDILPATVNGLAIDKCNEAIEISVIGQPTRRPYSQSIEDWMLASGVFQRVKQKAKYHRRLLGWV